MALCADETYIGLRHPISHEVITPAHRRKSREPDDLQGPVDRLIDTRPSSRNSRYVKTTSGRIPYAGQIASCVASFSLIVFPEPSDTRVARIVPPPARHAEGSAAPGPIAMPDCMPTRARVGTLSYPESTEAIGAGGDTKDDGQGKANWAGPIPTDEVVCGSGGIEYEIRHILRNAQSSLQDVSSHIHHA